MRPAKTRPANPTPDRLPPEETRVRILACAVALYARGGFHGVSMRDVARAVGVTPAALYYHFPDKEQLYLAAVGHVFNDRIPVALAALVGDGDAWTRLEAFLLRLTRVVAAETDFCRLMQWVLIDSDEDRARSLGETVFRPFFEAVAALVRDIDNQYDPHRLTMSILGAVVFPYHSLPVARFMPGFPSPESDPDAQARHVIALLKNGLPGGR